MPDNSFSREIECRSINCGRYGGEEAAEEEHSCPEEDRPESTAAER